MHCKTHQTKRLANKYRCHFHQRRLYFSTVFSRKLVLKTVESRLETSYHFASRSTTPTCIITAGRFPSFQRFSGSKMVLKTVGNCYTTLKYFASGSTLLRATGTQLPEKYLEYTQLHIITNARIKLCYYITSIKKSMLFLVPHTKGSSC